MQSRIFSIITPVFSDNFAASYFVWKECYSIFQDFLINIVSWTTIICIYQIY